MLSLVSGVILLITAFGADWKMLLAFLALGMVSIVAAITYTVGKRPYGYIGLGDASVLVFFGLVGVAGSYYLFTRQLTSGIVWPALSCGLFSIGVLNINNIRDIESDKKAGKFSIPVRMGKRNAALYHIAIVSIGVASAIAYTLKNYSGIAQWAFLLVVPLFVVICKAVWQKPSEQLDPYLKRMAMATLLFVLLFGIGLLTT